jgi:hypothetical protein
VNNYQVQFLVVILITVDLLISGVQMSYAQNTTKNENSSTGQVLVSKTASTNTIIYNGSSSVGGFNTTYTITGSLNDIKNSRDLITSSILDDFTNSSTIGYVKLSDSITDTGNQQIANPFASNEQVEEKITELLNKVTQDSSNDGIVSIACSFGNSLDLFACSH